MGVGFFYRRPAYVPRIASSTSIMSDTDSIKTKESSQSNRPPPGVPEALSFDKIIANGACPPCTLRDFMNYLLYIERTAENLQFFLWYRDYAQRFADLSQGEKALSREWTSKEQKVAWEDWQKSQAMTHKKKVSTATTELFKGTGFSEVPQPTMGANNPFETPPHTSHGAKSHSPHSSHANVTAPRMVDAAPWVSGPVVASYRGESIHTNPVSHISGHTATTVSSEAFQNAGLSQPFTIQPFREEIKRIIATYIVDNAPRQLNLSSGQRKTLLKALESTTHPSAFKIVISDIERTLRQQAHPNFIRWTICNGNRSRVLFARGLGVATILLGVIMALLITLSHLGRGYRALAAILFMLGFATLVAAYKGMCVVLHGMHHRHLRPWELFTDSDVENSKSSGESYDMRESVDTVLSSNSYEDAPWVVKYERQNVIRKVFDREVWIQEPSLRQIQDMIFWQSLLSACIATAVLTAIFVAVPKGNLF